MAASDPSGGRGAQGPWPLLALVLLALLALGGCASLGLIGAAMNPTAAADQVANDTVQSLTSVDPNQLANASGADIDRILAENPNATNAGDLRNLKDELAGQQTAGIKDVRRDDPQAEYASQRDRRMEMPDRRQTDNLVVRPLPTPDEVPYGLRASPETHPHGVDPEQDPRPPYVLETDRVRFGGQ